MIEEQVLQHLGKDNEGRKGRTAGVRNGRDAKWQGCRKGERQEVRQVRDGRHRAEALEGCARGEA